MAHPQGMTGLDFRANRVEGDPVFLLVDFGPAGTITSPAVLATLTMPEAHRLAGTLSHRLRSVPTNDVGPLCAWDYGTDDVQPHEGEFLCANCRATIARADILSTVD